MNKVLEVGLKMVVAAIGVVAVDNVKETIKEKAAKKSIEREIRKEAK